MNRNSMHILRITATLFGIVLLVAGCGMVIVESTWLSTPVTVDGIDGENEWEHAKYYFEDEQVTLGLKNDDDALFVYLSCGNEGIQRQIFAGGFTLWIDPVGGDEKRLGIKYPTGRQDGRQMTAGMGRGRPGQPDADSSAPPDLTMQLDQMPQYAQLIGFDVVDSSRVSCTDLATMGITVALGNAPGVLVYEIRLPLERKLSQPLALGIEGESLSLCLETEALQMPQGGVPGVGGRGGRGGGPGGGGMGGGMGGGPGGGMGGRGGGGGGMGGPGGSKGRIADLVDPIERWIVVELAQQQ